MFKSKSLFYKILSPIVIGVLVSAIVLITYRSISSKKNWEYLLNEFRESLTYEVRGRLKGELRSISSTIKAEIEVALDATRTMSEVLSTVDETHLTREQVNEMLKKVLGSNEDFLTTYTIWEPNAFGGLDNEYANTLANDNTGRFALSWSKTSSGGFTVERSWGEDDTTLLPNGSKVGDFYFIPKEKKKEAILDPFVHKIQGKKMLITTVSSPIIINNKFRGIVGIALSVSFIQDLADRLSKNIYDGAGSVVVVTKNGDIAGFSGKEELLGKKAMDTEINYKDLIKCLKNSEENIYRNTGTGKSIVQVPIKIGFTDTPWSVLLELPTSLVFKGIDLMKENMNKKVRSQNTIIHIFMFTIAIIFLIIIGLFIRYRVIKPLRKALRMLNTLNDGIVSKDLIEVKSNDEIGQIAKAINTTVTQINYLINTLKRVSNGDLTIQVSMMSDKDELSEALNKMVTELHRILLRLENSIYQVNQGADQISNSALSISQGASQQASSLEEITASLTEISSQIQEHTEGSVEVSKITENTRLNADKGSKQMSELVNAMNEIDKSAKDIKNIVEIIDDIAFQTNLLALNADIEAARVGKYGKGFAVVANSVRALANKSQDSVKETTKMVEITLDNIKRGVELVEITSKQLEEIKKESQKASDLAKESSRSSLEQAKGIEQISLGVSSVEDVVQSNSASAEENAASSEELAIQSRNLSDLVSYFKLKDDVSLNNDNLHKNLSSSELTLLED